MTATLRLDAKVFFENPRRDPASNATSVRDSYEISV